VSDGARAVVADRIVAATGYRPDHSFVSELRLDLDPILGSTRALAPLIDPNEHSCGTVPPHGVDELTHPEAGYYAVGVKSYGRAPTFLLATATSRPAPSWPRSPGTGRARDVQLDLPETGVCNSNLDPDSDTITASGGCCGAPAASAGRGLATGVGGGLLSAPLTLITLAIPDRVSSPTAPAAARWGRQRRWPPAGVTAATHRLPRLAHRRRVRRHPNRRLRRALLRLRRPAPAMAHTLHASTTAVTGAYTCSVLAGAVMAVPVGRGWTATAAGH